MRLEPCLVLGVEVQLVAGTHARCEIGAAAEAPKLLCNVLCRQTCYAKCFSSGQARHCLSTHLFDMTLEVGCADAHEWRSPMP